ncbi:983_t:CDS:2, partial [Racocetra persica]
EVNNDEDANKDAEAEEELHLSNYSSSFLINISSEPCLQQPASNGSSYLLSILEKYCAEESTSFYEYSNQYQKICRKPQKSEGSLVLRNGLNESSRDLTPVEFNDGL